MAELILEQISKTYSGHAKRDVPPKAVDDISFTVHDKEFMVIVGPSGCGKSTLLRMIAGLEDISKGTLSIDGHRMNDLSPKDRDIAMVFQNYALYPHMTVFDNLAFGLKLKHYSRSEIRSRVMQTAELLEIQDMLQRKPRLLSGGQRQRVAIGRAIIRRPKIFLFDEPLSNLDAKLRTQMRIELQKLHRKIGATIVYVTHDQTEAMTLGDRIAVLNKGKLMQLDTPIRLYDHPANRFVAGFIGSPSMNFITGSIRKSPDGFFFIPEDQACRISLGGFNSDLLNKNADRPILLGIRPEHVLICEEDDDRIVPDYILEVVGCENMGNEQLVYFTLANETFIVRRPPLDALPFGKRMGVQFLRNKLLFLD